MATFPTVLICPQGHGPGMPGSRFCNWCGAMLAVVQNPALPPVPYQLVPTAIPPVMPTVCAVCGGQGASLSADVDFCPQCRWLRPLLPAYHLDASVFQWAQDGQAMATLRGMASLNTVARSVSDKVGRPWIETTFNGIRLGPKQFPAVWKQAVLAARIVGLTHMPDVYISGERMWDAFTYGSDTNAFIVLGTAMITNFQGDELLFLLAREMGHCRAGHALWKTVIRFLAGDMGPRHGLMSEGALGAISPTKLIESAIEMPLMAWARQSEITADRAGLLAVADEALVRRVLLAWCIRSAFLLRQLNLEAWMEQEEGSADQLTRLSEMTSSSTPFITRRLRLLSQFAREPELMRWSRSIQSSRPKPAEAAPPPLPATAASAAKPTLVPPRSDSVRIACAHCRTNMRIPLASLQAKDAVNVRCPQCRNVITLRRKPAAVRPVSAAI